MPAKKNNKVPKFRLHKATGQGVVTIDGHDHYMGRFEDPASKERYDRLISKWLLNGRRFSLEQKDVCISEVIAAFWQHAQGYYRKPDGSATSTLDNFRQALRPLKRLYGSSPAAQFGPKALEVVQQEMVCLGWCRTNINRQISRVRSMFRWVASKEMIPVETYQALMTLPGLKLGRTKAAERAGIKPVPDHHIQAIEPHVSSQVWAMVQLQRLTAARPGELVIMRAIDLDTTGRVWTYTPQTHKTAYRGTRRTIYIGPRAQEVIKPFLVGRVLDSYMFSPAEADLDHRKALHMARKTPISCGNRPGTNKSQNLIANPVIGITLVPIVERSPVHVSRPVFLDGHPISYATTRLPSCVRSLAWKLLS